MLKNLEVVESAYLFTQEFTESPFSYVTLKNYLAFLNRKEHSNRFLALKAYLRTMDMKKINIQCEQQDFLIRFVKTSSSPESIIKILYSKPELQKDVKLVEEMNKRMNKKYFFWNKEDQVISLIPIRKSRISCLDQALIHRRLKKSKNTEFKKVFEAPIPYTFSDEEQFRPDRSTTDF